MAILGLIGGIAFIITVFACAFSGGYGSGIAWVLVAYYVGMGLYLIYYFSKE